MILREKLSEKPLELGVLDEWRVVVCKIYDYVRAKVKKQEGLSNSFNGDLKLDRDALSHRHCSSFTLTN
jgi:hypothetical protein